MIAAHVVPIFTLLQLGKVEYSCKQLLRTAKTAFGVPIKYRLRLLLGNIVVDLALWSGEFAFILGVLDQLMEIHKERALGMLVLILRVPF